MPLIIVIIKTNIESKNNYLAYYFKTIRNKMHRKIKIYTIKHFLTNSSIGLRHRMEGNRQEKQGNGSGEEDLRRLQEPDGRAAHIP